MRRNQGCPTCGSYGHGAAPQEIRGVQRVKHRSVHTPAHARKLPWQEQKPLREHYTTSVRVYYPTAPPHPRFGVRGYCPDPWHKPPAAAVPRFFKFRGYRPHDETLVDPAELPVVSHRPPKDRADEFADRRERRAKRHRDRQSKTRR